MLKLYRYPIYRSYRSLEQSTVTPNVIVIFILFTHRLVVVYAERYKSIALQTIETITFFVHTPI